MVIITYAVLATQVWSPVCGQSPLGQCNNPGLSGSGDIGTSGQKRKKRKRRERNKKQRRLRKAPLGGYGNGCRLVFFVSDCQQGNDGSPGSRKYNGPDSGFSGFRPHCFPVPDDDPPAVPSWGPVSSEKTSRTWEKRIKFSPVLKSGGRRRPFSLPAADFLLFFLRQRIFQILAERKSFAYFNKNKFQRCDFVYRIFRRGICRYRNQVQTEKERHKRTMPRQFFFIGSPPVLFSGNFILYCFHLYSVKKSVCLFAMNSKRMPERFLKFLLAFRKPGCYTIKTNFCARVFCLTQQKTLQNSRIFKASDLRKEDSS